MLNVYRSNISPNQVLHLTAFSLRSKAPGELGR